MPGFQSPITIKQAIERINANEYLLPSFQREFVWKPVQIEMLFDSIMKDYPISSMLFWKVKGDAKRRYKFYSVLKNYREFYQTHNECFNTENVNDFHAILDGQQRLTSLYIGLNGSYAYKRPRVRWENTEEKIPTRRLYLNLSKQITEDTEKSYQFEFLEDSITQQKDLYLDSNNEKWFKVSCVLSFQPISIIRFCNDNKLEDNESEVLSNLYQKITSENIINFYEEETSDPDKAVNIFVRINSGGTPLSFSDILMSLISANWEAIDARKEIQALVDNIRGMGFNIDQDLILKSFLVLYHKDVRFRINSFSNDFIKRLEENWVRIRDCIFNCFKLLDTFGLSNGRLTSRNAVLPIIFFMYYYINNYDAFITSISYKEERNAIKNWLLKALLLGSYGGSSDVAIAKSRRPMILSNGDAEITPIPSLTKFPDAEISKELGHQNISDEEIYDILSEKYGNRAFPILAILYENLDLKNNFDIDHIHPAHQCVQANLDPEIFNSIPNLQLLDSNENRAKQDKDLLEWINDETQASGESVTSFLTRHLIPLNVGYGFNDFAAFFEERKEMLFNRLKSILRS